MGVIYTSQAKEDLEYWVKHNPKIVERINKLIDSIQQSPFSGIGKPEPLRFENGGFWSRRIDSEHRLVYKVALDKLFIAQCRYHY